MKKFGEFINENKYQPHRREVDESTEELQCDPGEMFCPYCGIEQDEHPRNLLMDNINEQECDECNKTFELDEVYYLVCRKQ